MGTVGRGLSSERALALGKPFFYLPLQSSGAVDALDLGVQGNFVLAARSFSNGTPANGGSPTSALQSDISLIVLLRSF